MTSRKYGKPAEKATVKGESRHKMYWYPNRCEHFGCVAELPKLICSACKCVKYYTKEH